MDKIEISKACKKDIDDIASIEKLCFTVPWSKESIKEEIIANNLAIYLCAKLRGKIIGYAGFWEITDEAHITNIAVHPEFRMNNVGSKLLENLIGICKQSGIKSMTLEVRKSNLAALGLYKKFGFNSMGTRKAYYSDNKEDAIIMWKYI
jgi:[ribosomal protein S18]-alanine N-acetyltransferase